MRTAINRANGDTAGAVIERIADDTLAFISAPVRESRILRRAARLRKRASADSRSVYHCAERARAWAEAARRLDCLVVGETGGGASYAPRDAILYAGVIRYDTTCPTLVQARQIVHELTHHVLYWWPPRLSGAEQAALLRAFPGTLEFGAGGFPRSLEERVCRRVEEKAMPLPSGLQRNGRLAIPLAPRVVVRVYGGQVPGLARGNSSE